MQQETTDSIVVLIRIRPFSEREKLEDSRSCFKIDDYAKNTIIFDSTTKSETRYFTFDHVCPENINQEEIFRIVGIPTATSCLQGYNGCIFAYGQTGAGKTFTIQGQGLDISMNQSISPEENDKRGLLPRVIDYMFSDIESAHSTSSSVRYSVKCSFLEIYNEHIIDLLNPSAKNLQIREDLKKGVYVEGLTEEVSANAMDTLEIVKRGNRSRHIGSTNMNIESSRSHSLFTFAIEAKALKDGVTNTRKSRFSFVDLAGSERQKMVGTAGERLKEGCLINKSLMVLANVINSLVDISEGKSRFVHYRDSKLTFLLKDSIGGNSKTSIIANISPANSSYGETLSTLKFAQRAKLIKNKVHINEDTSGTLEGLKSEIHRLRQELANMRNLINIGGIRYSDERRDLSRSSFDIGLSQAIDQTNDFLLWNPDEQETKDTHKNHELETLLKQSLDILTESESHLLGELTKKDDLIERLKGSKDVADKNELQMKMVIKLLSDKVNRYKGFLEKKVLTKEDCLEMIEEEQRSDFKTKILKVLRDPANDLFRDQSLEISDLREENNKLREEYMHLMELLTSKDDQGNMFMTNSQNQKGSQEAGGEMEVEGKPLEQDTGKVSAGEFEALREEYEKLIGEFEKIVYDLEEKTREIALLKDVNEKQETEKKAMTEEIEVFAKEVEGKVRTEYDRKIEVFLQEQEVLLNQFREDFLRVKEERDTIQKNVELFEDQFKDMEERCKELIIQKETLSNSLEAYKEREMQLSQETQDKTAEIERQGSSMQNEIKQLAIEMGRLQTQVQTLTEENVALKQENENNKSQYQMILEAGDQKEKEYEVMKGDLENVRLACLKKSQEIVEVQSLYEKLQEEYSTKTEELANTQQFVERLQSEIVQKNEEISEIRNHIENLQQGTVGKNEEITAIRRDYDELQSKYLGRENEFAALTQTYEALNGQFSIQEQEMKEMRKNHEEMLNELNNAKTQIETLESNYAMLNGQYEEKEQESRKLSEESQKLQEEYQAKSKELETFTKEFQELKGEYSTKCNEVESIRADFDAVHQNSIEQVKQLEYLRQEYLSLQKVSSEKIQEAHDIKMVCEGLEVNLFNKENEIRALKAQYEESQQKDIQTERQIELLTNQYNGLQEELESKKREIESIHQESESLRHQVQSQEEQMNVLQDEREAIQQEVLKKNQQIESIRNEYEQMVEKYERRGQEVVGLTEEYEKLKQAHIVQETSLGELKSQFEELMKGYMQKEDEHNKLKEKNADLKQDLISRNNDYDSLNNKYEALAKENEAKQSECNYLGEEKQRLIVELEDTSKTLDLQKEEGVKLMERYEELKSERDDLSSQNEKYQQNEVELRKGVEYYVEAMEKMREEHHRRAEEFNNEYERLVQENKVAVSEQGLLSEKLAEKTEEIEMLVKEIQHAKAEFKIKEEELKAIIAKEEERAREFETDSEKLLELRDKLAQTEAELDNKTEEIVIQRQEIKNYKKTQEALLEEKAALEENENLLRQEIDQLAGEMSRVTFEKNEENAKLGKRLQAFEQQCSELSNILANKSGELVDLQEKYNTITEEKDILTKQLQEKKRKEAKLFEENQQYNENLKKAENAWRNTVHELERQNSDLLREKGLLEDHIRDFEPIKSEWAGNKESVHKLETTNRDYERRLREAKELQMRASKESESLRRELDVRHEEIEDMRREYEKLLNEREGLAEEVQNYKGLEARLREEVTEYSKKISNIYGAQEKEINEVKDQYIRLTHEHKNLMRSIGMKEDQMEKMKAEFHGVLAEREKLHETLRFYKDLEGKLRQDNQDAQEKISRLNSDQYLLLKEIDNLNKANDTLGGHNNMGQKIRHLNKLKEENNKLKNEKIKACDDLTKVMEHNERLQRKVDELMIREENSRGSYSSSQRDTTNTFAERKSIETQALSENLSRINALIQSNLSREDAKYVHAKSNDIESILNGVQALTMLIMEKNKIIHNRDTELESVGLKNSILEKEVLLLKQKMYTSNPSTTGITDVSNLRTSQQSGSPQGIRMKSRAPTPGKSLSGNESFQKFMEQKLGNIVHNRSNSMKKQEPKPVRDENSMGYSFESQLRSKQTPSRKNLLK